MAATTRRKSAEERREEILAIAIEHFAASGFRGTSTAVIAREAGISHPYLFRLFRTKKELFLPPASAPASSCSRPSGAPPRRRRPASACRRWDMPTPTSSCPTATRS
jgi:hypothetical protein